jgi:hypothetical protein
MQKRHSGNDMEMELTLSERARRCSPELVPCQVRMTRVLRVQLCSAATEPLSGIRRHIRLHISANNKLPYKEVPK